mgnify:CR=1 FL=1
MNPLELHAWSLYPSIGLFIACAAAIAVFGTRITVVVDQLADRTGAGEAITGAVLLGASTSLAGSVLSVTAALGGRAELALANALGGIAVQTAFLAVADLLYRRANLEHAAASAQNMMQNALLIVLLALILLAPQLPGLSVWGIHPITPVLLVVYLYGLRLIRDVREQPMWRPTLTSETRQDTPEDMAKVPGLAPLVGRFCILLPILGISGWLLQHAASNIVAHTWLSAAVVGVLFTAVSTSLPELVTSIAAVRRGALTLAVSGIIGGNAFDTLFTAASDVAYRSGSIYHAMSDSVVFWTTLTVVMTGVLMMGLIRRERRGPGVMGVESLVLLLLYGAGVGILVLGLNAAD